MIKRVTRVARRSLGLGLLLLVPAAAPADAQTGLATATLSAVTVSTQPDSVTVFIKTSGPVKYESDLIEGPDRVVVDLQDTTYAWRRNALPVTAEPLRQVRGSQYRKDVARVVVELTRKVGYAIREDRDGLSIIIPTQLVAAERSGAPTATTAKPDAAPATTTEPAGTTQGAAAPEPATPVRPRAVAPTAIVAPRVAQATPAPAAPPAASQRLISLDFKEADVVNLLRILAAESGRNIVIGDDVKGKTSIALRNVPWELALDTILESRGLERVERDGVMRIVSTEQLAKERAARTRSEEARIKSETDIRAKIAEAELKEQEAQARKLAAEIAAAEAAARGPLREETIRLSYADPEDVARTLQGILGLSGDTTPVSAAPIPGPGPIPAPPFSQLFGQAQTVPPPPGALISPTADVLAKGITIRAHKPTNSIFIRHYAADLERLKKLIAEKLDIPLPQVKIEARMEILDRSDLFALGVQWGFGGVATTPNATLVGRGFTSNQQPAPGIAPSGVTSPNPNLTLDQGLPVLGATGLPFFNPTTLVQQGGNVVSLPIGAIGSLVGAATSTGVGGLSFGIIGTRMNVNLALEALRTEGKTRTLARPEVITVENNKATISLGEEIPYATVSSAGTQIQFKEALLKLEVVPTVVRESDHNRIKMKVIVENNSRGVDVVDLGAAGSPPVINRRKAETEVLIREGERLVIGGVTVSENSDAIRKVPLFGDIPVLGWLFKQNAERSASRELVIFITPSVVPRDMPSASLTTGTAQRR